ncbi:MAG: hypothetical protein PHU48_07650, partial [Candidatus Cloacimonetes bacterium]|nr:hypothetical protein [Candidatus Cloacimonadota bacterium]
GMRWQAPVCHKCGYEPHLRLGWQALFATKAEGFFLPTFSALPSRSLADHFLLAPTVHLNEYKIAYTFCKK